MNQSTLIHPKMGICMGVHVKLFVPVDLHYALTVNDKKKRGGECAVFLDEKNDCRMKNNLYRWCTTGEDGLMPSQRKADKRQISVWIPIALFRKFQKRAKALNMTMSEIITAFLVQQTQDVTLTPEEYEEIVREVRKKTNNN